MVMKGIVGIQPLKKGPLIPAVLGGSHGKLPGKKIPGYKLSIMDHGTGSPRNTSNTKTEDQIKT